MKGGGGLNSSSLLLNVVPKALSLVTLKPLKAKSFGYIFVVIDRFLHGSRKFCFLVSVAFERVFILIYSTFVDVLLRESLHII